MDKSDLEDIALMTLVLADTTKSGRRMGFSPEMLNNARQEVIDATWVKIRSRKPAGF